MPAALYEAIADTLAGELEDHAPGRDPGIYTIQVTDAGPVLRQVPVPPGMWHPAIPKALTLRLLAERLASAARVLPALVPDLAARLERIHALAYRAEAHAVDGDARLAAAVMRGEQPGEAVPCQMFAAVDRAGVRYTAALLDGEGRAEREVIRPDPAGGSLGSVIESLDMMMDAVARLTGER